MKTPKDDILESFIAKTKLMDSEKLKTTFCTVHSRHSTIESKTPEGQSATLESRYYFFSIFYWTQLLHDFLQYIFF